MTDGGSGHVRRGLVETIKFVKNYTSRNPIRFLKLKFDDGVLKRGREHGKKLWNNKERR